MPVNEKKPFTYTFTYQSIASSKNESLSSNEKNDHHRLLSIQGPINNFVSLDFRLLPIQAISTHNQIRLASSEDFYIKKMLVNQVQVMLKRGLQGPQNVTLELEMNILRQGVWVGFNKAVLHLFVGAYPF